MKKTVTMNVHPKQTDLTRVVQKACSTAKETGKVIRFKFGGVTLRADKKNEPADVMACFERKAPIAQMQALAAR